jgi:hypothetical protein
MRSFAVGQRVRFKTWVKAASADEPVFVVLAHLPPVEGAIQYRLRSEAEKFERVAREDALVPAPDLA